MSDNTALPKCYTPTAAHALTKMWEELEEISELLTAHDGPLTMGLDPRIALDELDDGIAALVAEALEEDPGLDPLYTTRLHVVCDKIRQRVEEIERAN